MEFVRVREPRTRVDRDAEGISIAVPRRRPLWRLLVPAWAVFVVALGLVMMLTGDQPEPPPLAFIALWTGVGVAVVALSSWGLLGRETIRLTPRALMHERGLGPVARRRAFDRTRVEDLRVSAESVSMWDPRAGFRMYGIGAGTVAFDYGDRTVRVADTEEAEAKRIVEALRREGL